MEWNQVIADPFLQNLPYKIELNQWGKIVLSPASNKHGLLQAELAGFLRDAKKNGKVITECSVNTHKGVKVADIIWESDDFFRRNALDTPYQEAPELCIEILSPSNSKQEIEEKIHLYLSKGAKEVWICDEDGWIRYHSYRGEVEASHIFPDAPTKIDI